MALKTFVKAGNITNLSDARYCAGMGVDLLGFRTIEGQENYIRASQFQEIRGWITGPRIVAEIYGLKHPNELLAILENYKPDYLEMGVSELALFSDLPLPFILSVHASTDFNKYSLRPEYLLSKTIVETDVPLLVELQSPAETNSLLQNPRVKGIALSGTSELKPGLKDFELIAEVLELLEIED